MNAFDLSPDPKQTHSDPQTLYLRIKTLPESEQKLEDDLQATAWFPYRYMDHVERTQAFVRAYSKICASLSTKNPEIPIDSSLAMKAKGQYLKRDEILAPWIDYKSKKQIKLNPRWKHWVRARRLADAKSMIYEDYIAGAVLSAMKRGWSRWPPPTSLASEKLLGLADNYTEATIPGYVEAKYEKLPKLTSSLVFPDGPGQLDGIRMSYVVHVLKEFQRVWPSDIGLVNQKAKRAWRELQADGRLPKEISFEKLLQPLLSACYK